MGLADDECGENGGAEPPPPPPAPATATVVLTGPPARFAFSKRRRVAMAVAFSLNNAANAYLWIWQAPVVAATSRVYAASAGAVNELSLEFLYAYAPGLVLAALVTRRAGLRAAVALGAVLNVACGWVRVASVGAARRGHAAFGVLAAGQALGALGQPCFTNAPALLALEWFPPEEREHVVVWTSVSNILGNALGSAIPGFVVSRATEAADIEAQLIGQALFVTVLLAATLVALYPPAACRCAGDGDAAADAGKGGSEDNDEWRDAARRMLRDSAALMRTRAYWPLWVAVAVGVGLSISLLTLVAQMIGPCGYGADAASLLGGALLVVGIVCAGVTGALLTKWPRLQMPIMRSLVFVLAAALVGSLACLRRGVLGPLAVTWAAMGGAMIPLLPVSLQVAAAAAAEVGAPADLAAGLMLLAGQYVGVVYVFVQPALLARRVSATCASALTPHAGFLVAQVALACVAICVLRRAREPLPAGRVEAGADGEQPPPAGEL